MTKVLEYEYFWLVLRKKYFGNLIYMVCATSAGTRLIGFRGECTPSLIANSISAHRQYQPLKLLVDNGLCEQSRVKPRVRPYTGREFRVWEKAVWAPPCSREVVVSGW